MIMFIDDEPFFVDAYVQALTDAGYRVSFHKSLVEAMKFYEQHKEDVKFLITDVMMPNRGVFTSDEGPNSDLQTGFAVYDWFRRQSASLPIIILTNKNTPDVDKKFGHEDLCWLYRKGPRCSPFKLVQQIKDLQSSSEA